MHSSRMLPMLVTVVLGLTLYASTAVAQSGSGAMTQHGSGVSGWQGPTVGEQRGPQAAARPGSKSTPTSGDWLPALMRLRPAPSHSRAPTAARVEAVERLGRYGEPDAAVESLVSELLSDPPLPVRRAILEALARRGHPKSADALCELFREGAEPVAGVATALAAVDNGQAARCLIRGLDVPALADEAHRGLVRMGSGAVPFVLTSLSKALTRGAADRAVRILGEIGDPRAAHALVKRLSPRVGPDRVSALQALATTCDKASASKIAQLLDDSSAAVVRAALRALATCGGPAQTAAVVQRIRRGDPVQMLEALNTLVAIAPARARPHLERAIRSEEPKLQMGAIQLAVDTPRTELVPVLVRTFRRGVRREAAASCLARVPDASGLRALLNAVADDPGAAERAARAIAIGLRARPKRLDRGMADQAHGILRALTHRERRMVLRALARDHSVSQELISGLEASEAQLRASAALGIQMLGRDAPHSRALKDALMRALRAERDAEAFRRQASAALDLGIEVPLPQLLGHLSNPATSAEAMLLAAESSARAEPRHRRRLAKSLRRSLRSRGTAHARTRAAAALALARMDRGRAFSVLSAALSDASGPVRMSVIRALGSLGGSDALSVLLAHARVEPADNVRSLALSAARTLRKKGSLPLYLRGSSELELQIRPASGTRLGRLLVDVILPDGRWLRLRTLEGGELIVPGLPHGHVDVRIQEPSGAAGRK